MIICKFRVEPVSCTENFQKFISTFSMQRDLEAMQKELARFPHRQYLKIKILNLTKQLKESK